MAKPKWTFSNLDELHQVGNATLRFAMINERSKRWSKVVESYKRLIWLIDRGHFPDEYETPASYSMLLYELHYHLGVALQHIGEHRKAISSFTNAINVVSIPKGGCLAGCLTNSCLMTPIYARRAFAHCRVGNMGSAIRDAEKSVVLDSKNPDVFCIRALVRGSRDEETMALKDVDQALRLSPNNVCAMIIRGAIMRPLAEKINPEMQSYLYVTSFDHPNILEFFDRFLFTLSVPHTITDINLTPDKPSKRQLEGNLDLYSKSEKTSRPSSSKTSNTDPFRCGTPYSSDNKLAARRRFDYGEAVRKYMSRPKTASQYIAMLEKERKKTAEASTRATSAGSQVTSRANTNDRETRNSTVPSRRIQTSATKTIIIETPVNYNIPVFQQMNIKQAPRMYYRPWRGDKLPVAVVNHPKPKPAFY